MEKDESIKLKAVAVMLMFWLHLFGCGDSLSGGELFEWNPVFGRIDELLGRGGNLCIPIFSFVTGYGMYKSYIKEAKYSKIILSMIRFLIQYWVIMIVVAIPYLIVFGKFNANYILVNLFSILHNDNILYVSLSWYVKVHVLLLLSCPIIKILSNKIRSFISEIFIYIVMPILLTFILPNSEFRYDNALIGILSTIRLWCFWLPVFYLGVIAAKYQIIEKFRDNKCRNDALKKIISVVAMLVIVVIMALTPDDVIINLFCTALFVLFFDCIYVGIKLPYLVDKYWKFVGDYSFQYWLLSGMFYLNTTEFLWVLYQPKLSILIFIWNFIVLTPGALFVRKLATIISDKIVMFLKTHFPI